MIKNNDISCVFNDCASLLLSQHTNLDIWLETISDNDFDDHFFKHPFCVFHMDGSEEHRDIYPFFKRLLDCGDEYSSGHSLNRGAVEKYKTTTLTQSIGHGAHSELSFNFTENGLVGLSAGGRANSYETPTIWTSTPQDKITRKMKEWVLSR